MIRAGLQPVPDLSSRPVHGGVDGDGFDEFHQACCDFPGRDRLRLHRRNQCERAQAHPLMDRAGELVERR